MLNQKVQNKGQEFSLTNNKNKNLLKTDNKQLIIMIINNFGNNKLRLGFLLKTINLEKRKPKENRRIPQLI